LKKQPYLLGKGLRKFLIVLTAYFSLVSCDNNAPETTSTTHPDTSNEKPFSAAEPALLEALSHYNTAQINALSKTYQCTESLTLSLNDDFLPSPSQATLSKSLQSLEQCLSLYLPIHTLLAQSTDPQITQLTSSLYSSPILPGYVDYLLQYPNSGIVNDITLSISNASLRDQQGLTDSGEVSLGFEVIAFLLLGEQRYNNSLAPRPATDFAQPTEEQQTVENHSDRRRQYLRIAMALLQEDLNTLSEKLKKTQQMEKADKNPSPISQTEALRSASDIINTMLQNIQQQKHDELSNGYWQLLKHKPDNSGSQTSTAHSTAIQNNDEKNDTSGKKATTTNTLATYLKWPKGTPDLSHEAFAAQLQASLQRLNSTQAAPR